MGKLINLTGLSEIRLAPLAANFIEERKGQGLILTTSASRAKRIASDLSFFTDADIKVLPDVESASFRYEAKSTAIPAAYFKPFPTLFFLFKAGFKAAQSNANPNGK